MLELHNLVGECPTCKHYGKSSKDYPCVFCNDQFSRWESVNEKILKYDVRLQYINDKKLEIFNADKAEFLGTVLLVIKGNKQYYYPIYQVTNYEIIEKEVDPNGDDTSNK